MQTTLYTEWTAPKLTGERYVCNSLVTDVHRQMEAEIGHDIDGRQNISLTKQLVFKSIITTTEFSRNRQTVNKTPKTLIISLSSHRFDPEWKMVLSADFDSRII